MDGTTFNIGYIETSGRVVTSDVNGAVSRDLGFLDHTHRYVEELAQLIGGEIAILRGMEDHKYVVINGRNPLIEQLLDHEDGWFEAIERLRQRINQHIDASMN